LICKQVAPNGASICYGIISCYKQIAPTELTIDKFFKLVKPEKILPSDYAYKGKILQKNNKDSLAIINLKKAIELDSENNCDLNSNIAGIYKKLKKYNEAIEAYNKKIACKSSVGDYLNLSTTYYSVKQFGKADTAIDNVITAKPDFLSGLVWKARINSSIDSLMKEGRAKPHYEKVLEIAMKDSAKCTKEIIESYDYLSYLYFKKEKNYCEAKKYYEKMLAIEPKNQKGLDGLAGLKKSFPNLKCDK